MLPEHVVVDGHRIHLQQALDLMVDVLEGRAVLVHPDADDSSICWLTGRSVGGKVVKHQTPTNMPGHLAHLVFERWGRSSRRGR